MGCPNCELLKRIVVWAVGREVAPVMDANRGKHWIEWYDHREQFLEYDGTDDDLLRALTEGFARTSTRGKAQ